jgi:hypothetical protein
MSVRADFRSLVAGTLEALTVGRGVGDLVRSGFGGALTLTAKDD